MTKLSIFTLFRTQPCLGQTCLKLYTLFRAERPTTIPCPAAHPHIAHKRSVLRSGAGLFPPRWRGLLFYLISSIHVCVVPKGEVFEPFWSEIEHRLSIHSPSSPSEGSGSGGGGGGVFKLTKQGGSTQCQQVVSLVIRARREFLHPVSMF